LLALDLLRVSGSLRTHSSLPSHAFGTHLKAPISYSSNNSYPTRRLPVALPRCLQFVSRQFGTVLFLARRRGSPQPQPQAPSPFPDSSRGSQLDVVVGSGSSNSSYPTRRLLPRHPVRTTESRQRQRRYSSLMAVPQGHADVVEPCHSLRPLLVEGLVMGVGGEMNFSSASCLHSHRRGLRALGEFLLVCVQPSHLPVSQVVAPAMGPTTPTLAPMRITPTD
jgi:hypothetical protein